MISTYYLIFNDQKSIKIKLFGALKPYPKYNNKDKLFKNLTKLISKYKINVNKKQKLKIQ